MTTSRISISNNFKRSRRSSCSFFWGSSINRFTPTQLGWLTTTQISGLGSDQIEWLGAAVLNSFSQQQLQALPTLSTIATSVLAQLSTGTLSEFTAQQAASLTRAQLASLSGQQLTALNAGVWGLFDAAQVNGLSIEQLAALPQLSISAISNSAAQGLAIGGSLQSWLTSSRTASSPPPLASLSGHVTAISTSGTLAVAISAVTASLGDNGGAYLWNGSSWNALPGNWQKVVTSPDGSIWGINDSGEVERYVINQWVDEGERASDIAAGSDGSLFAVGTSGNLLQWDSGSWNNLGGSLSKVAVGADGSLWAIGTDTNVYQFQPIVLQRYTAGRWANQGLSGATAIAAGGDGDVFVLGGTNVAGGNLYQWNGNGEWTAQAETLNQVEVDASGPVYDRQQRQCRTTTTGRYMGVGNKRPSRLVLVLRLEQHRPKRRCDRSV